MSQVGAATAGVLGESRADFRESRIRSTLNYCLHNPRLLAGLIIILGLLLFWLVGSATIDMTKARPLSALPDQEPSREYPLGTDTAGRELLPVLIAAIPRTF